MNDSPQLDPETRQHLICSSWNETVGTATMRLVHDFNNLLTGILSLSDAYLQQVEESNPVREGLSLMHQNARQAAGIVREIMRLYQEQPGKPSYQDLIHLVPYTCELLKTILPRHTALSIETASQSLPVYIDPIGFRRAFISVALMLAEAMPPQGELSVKTIRVDSAPPTCSVEISAPCRQEMIGGFFAETSRRLPDRAGIVRLAAEDFLNQNGGGLRASLKEKRANISLWLPPSNFTELERDLAKKKHN
jgi:hypothetical protein